MTTVSSNGLSSCSMALGPSGARAGGGGALSAGASLSTGSTSFTGSSANLFSKPCGFSCSKGQSRSPRRVGKSLDSTMKFVTVPVKANTLDADTESLLCYSLTHRFSSLLVAGVGQLISQSLHSGAGRGECGAGGIVYNLSVDMPVRTKHRESRPVRRPGDLFANVILSPDCCTCSLPCTFHFSIPESKLLCRT